MQARAVAVIDIKAAKHNLEQVIKFCPSSKIIAMIKANGYGHGIVAIAKAFAEADILGVACINEALTLRKNAISMPIMVMSGFQSISDYRIMLQQDFIAVIHHHSQLEILKQNHASKKFNVWLKLDTGMHRLGFSLEWFKDIYTELKALPNVNLLGVMSHFSMADDVNSTYTNQQIAAFDKELAGFNLPRSLANSAGILAFTDSHREWVRPGLMLYGVSPFIDKPASYFNLQPVMTLKSHILAVNNLKAGAKVSYSGKWQAPYDTTIGVVGIGYGDGYPYTISAGTNALIAGNKVPIVGSVCMDMLLVDLKNCPDVVVGTEVVLWGRDLAVTEIARSAKTISYDLFTGITSRVEYSYV